MRHTANILVSNIALPNTDIGSWTTRMSRFIKDQPTFFQYILSPSGELSNALYCSKRKFITWKQSVRKLQLQHWVARDYTKAIKEIANNYAILKIVIMDDPHLLEAITHLKSKISKKLIVIYSFHGFQLNIGTDTLAKTHKVLWLSKAGIEKNKSLYSGNFPKSIVVGNAVDSSIFYPLDINTFNKERETIGYKSSDEILIWMANDRPKKGFHIFEKVVAQLLEIQKELKVITIGTTKTIDHPRVNTVGRLPNEQVSKYLQLGNYYMFTTLYEEGFGLSMIEAYKCGNAVMASKLGAIPEALEGRVLTYLIQNPESVDEWVEAFNMAKQDVHQKQQRLSMDDSRCIWNYEDWASRFKQAIIADE